VTCMETAGEGGPYGMALLSAYMLNKRGDETLEDYLNTQVFSGVAGTTLTPDSEDVKGFNTWMEQYKNLLRVEQAAVEVL
jgi:hypothetical protein